MADFAEEHPEVIAAFHLMWDHFPGSATLVHKSRKVIAANPLGLAAGREPGVICAKLPGDHSHCLGNQTLKENATKAIRKMIGEDDRLVFWQPLDGFPDYFLHYSYNLPVKD